MRSIEGAVVHCSATRGDLALDWRNIDQMHRDRGFSFTWQGQTGHIGYHYVILLDGSVQAGRPLEIPGAHVQGHNQHTIGICLIGGLDAKGKPKNTYTEAQMRSLEHLLVQLLDRFPGMWIKGHRDLSPDKNRNGKIEPNEWLKQCPCFDVQPWAQERGLVPRLS